MFFWLKNQIQNTFLFTARELRESEAKTPTAEGQEAQERTVDWDFAHEELMAKQGIDLKQEMAKKLKDMEDQWRREKEEANEAFQQERKVKKISIIDNVTQ